uniref:Putative secreted protein n=1 Tax=Anopheles darlingi TaxID=43151 RepID=A0A2M4D9W4_ANODA
MEFGSWRDRCKACSSFFISLFFALLSLLSGKYICLELEIPRRCREKLGKNLKQTNELLAPVLGEKFLACSTFCLPGAYTCRYWLVAIGGLRHEKPDQRVPTASYATSPHGPPLPFHSCSPIEEWS